MSSKRMHPIKTTVNIHHSIESCPHSAWLVICLPTYNVFAEQYQLHESTYSYSTLWCSFGTGRVRLFEVSLPSHDMIPRLFCQWWFPIIAPWPRNYNFSRIAEWVHNLLAMCERLNILTMGVAKRSTHYLIDACFLTTECDKRMPLLTRLYGILLRLRVTVCPRTGIPHSQ